MGCVHVWNSGTLSHRGLLWGVISDIGLDVGHVKYVSCHLGNFGRCSVTWACATKLFSLNAQDDGLRDADS
jgi:hypothetical protein